MTQHNGDHRIAPRHEILADNEPRCRGRDIHPDGAHWSVAQTECMWCLRRLAPFQDGLPLMEPQPEPCGERM